MFVLLAYIRYEEKKESEGRRGRMAAKRKNKKEERRARGRRREGEKRKGERRKIYLHEIREGDDEGRGLRAREDDSNDHTRQHPPPIMRVKSYVYRYLSSFSFLLSPPFLYIPAVGSGGRAGLLLLSLIVISFNSVSSIFSSITSGVAKKGCQR